MSDLLTEHFTLTQDTELSKAEISAMAQILGERVLLFYFIGGENATGKSYVPKGVGGALRSPLKERCPGIKPYVADTDFEDELLGKIAENERLIIYERNLAMAGERNAFLSRLPDRILPIGIVAVSQSSSAVPATGTVDVPKPNEVGIFIHTATTTSNRSKQEKGKIARQVVGILLKIDPKLGFLSTQWPN